MFGCIGDGGALGYLDLRAGLLNGLEQGDRSWPPTKFSGEGGDYPNISGVQSDCADKTLQCR